MRQFGACLAAVLACGAQATSAETRRHSNTAAALTAEESVFRTLKNEGFSGSVAVYRDDRLLLARASGQANRTSPFKIDTKVDVASLSKPITALAIFKLAESGKLGIDDPLGKWLPAAPADKQGITIRQMLNHSSGLVDIPPGMSDYRPISEVEMQQRIFAEPLDFPPGSKNSYSNSGYNLLGIVVEKASGRSLFEFLRSEIFRPAQIQASYDPEAFPAAMVASSLPDPPGAPSVRDIAAARKGPFWGLWGAGGIFMSASDYAKLFRAFHQHKIVSAASARRMTTEVVPAGSYAAEGLGWTIIHTSRGDDFISYTGGSEHSTSAVRYYPRGDLLITVVANSSSPGAIRTARELAEPLVGPDFKRNVVPSEAPPLALAEQSDLHAIQSFVAAVSASGAARLNYIATNFDPAYRKQNGDAALSEKLTNLASIGTPKIISIYRRGADSVLVFETQESEYPRLYELVLHRLDTAGLITGYSIRRLSA